MPWYWLFIWVLEYLFELTHSLDMRLYVIRHQDWDFTFYWLILQWEILWKLIISTLMHEWVCILIFRMIVRKRNGNFLLDIWEMIVLKTVRTFKVILIYRSEIQYRQTCIIRLCISSVRLIQLHIALKDLLFIVFDWIVIVEYLWNKVVQRVALRKTVSPLFFLILHVVGAFVQNNWIVACFLWGALFRHKKTSRGNSICQRQMAWGECRFELLRI